MSATPSPICASAICCTLETRMPHEKPRPPAHPSSCLFNACANIQFAHVCHTCCVYVDLSSRIFAYGPLSGCVHAPLSLCMHAHCYCAIYSEGVHARFSTCGCMHISSLQYVTNTGFRLVLETFVYLRILALAVILSPFPLPYPPSLPSDKHAPCPLSQLKTIWLGLPPSIIMVVQRRNLRLVRGSADSACLRARRYLHHAPPRPHTRPRTLTTPLHATILHSHLLPAHTPAPHSHLYFGYKLTVTARTTGLAPNVAKDRAPPHPLTPWQGIQKALVVPLSSPHQRAFVCGACMGTAQVGVSLVSLFDPLFKRFRLHCFDVCLT